MITDLKTYNRCNICIEEECKGKKNCSCSTCEHLKDCPKLLHATIRITNKCTQKCAHCGFSSSPDSKIMMSLDVANDIAKFIDVNNVSMLNVMGGEFFCNPDWFDILKGFLNVALHVRLVTNADWANNENVKLCLKYLVETYRDKLKISISKDQWHTNKFVDKASEFLAEINANYNIATNEETTENSIVPVGRGELATYNNYSMFNFFCGKPSEHYHFLIDEDGKIYKCGFGTFSYADIYEYLSGGFEDRFKKYNKAFYKCFIPNCRACRNIAKQHNFSKEYNNKKMVVSTN